MKALEKYTFKRFRRLKTLLKRYSSEENTETLHGIRVEIKKIKVILGLINEYEKGFHAHRHFKPLRDIFRKAGEIRQPQVFYELLLRYEIQGLADSHIPGSGRQDALSKKFRREVPMYMSIARKRKRKLEKSIVKISVEQVRQYVKKKKKALRRMFSGDLSADTLHKARKVIKEILYLETAAKRVGKREKYFGQLDELIGQWHDRQLLLEVLKKGKSPEVERMTSERDQALQDISQSISDFYSRK